jgi:hypothetical protein
MNINNLDKKMKIMKKYRFQILLLIIIIIAGLQSCSEEFLELEPKINKLEGNSYKTESEAFNAMVSVYKAFTASNGLENVPINSDIYSDDAYAAGEPGGGMWESWQPIEIGIIDPETSSIDLWEKFYRGVYLANLYLQKEVDIEWTTTGKRERMKAEVLTLRAHFYWDLVRLFGWVPVMEEIPPDIEAVKSITQSTPEEVYRLVLRDLLIAFPDLPETVTSSEKGRITKDVVRMLIARIYLYYEGFVKTVMGVTNDWTDGTTVINKAYVQNLMETIINSNRYVLLDDYADIFDWDNQNNEESIFEWQYSEKGLSGWDDGSLTRDGNFSCQIYGIRAPVDTSTTSGWSFATLTFTLVDEFEEGDYRLGVSVYNNEDSIGQGSHGNQYQYTGYFNNKYLPNAEYRPTGGDAELNWPINYKDMRYAEALLIAAELFMDDQPGKAVGYLNQVRTRGMGEGAALSASELDIDAIYHERRVEFAGEGHRKWDLMRRSLDYAKVMIDATFDTSTFPDYVTKDDFVGREFYKDTWGMLPIPASEIRAMNEGVLQQYVPAFK